MFYLKNYVIFSIRHYFLRLNIYLINYNLGLKNYNTEIIPSSCNNGKDNEENGN